MKRSQILLISLEPDEDIRRMEANALREQGHQLISPMDASEVLQQATGCTFELILLDLGLSDDSRRTMLELLERLKELQPAAPVLLILSGHETQDQLLEVLQRGIKGVVLRRKGLSHLQEMVKTALEEFQRAQDQIRSRLLTSLYEISEDVLPETRQKSLLQRIIQTAQKKTDADTVSLMLLNERPAELRIAGSIGLSPEVVQMTRTKVGERISGWVAQVKTPLVLVKETPLDSWIRTSMFQPGVEAAICCPLLRKDKVVGVLNVSKQVGKGTFSQTDIELVTILSRQAAVVLDNLRLLEEITKNANDLKLAHFNTIRALAEALETKDVHTHRHSERTVELALMIADELSLASMDREYVRYAAILHDIGKIGIPEAILNKPAPLTPEEYELMKKHPMMGAEIVKQVEFLAPVVPLVRHDHERFDGKGYPDGLRGNQIPLGSRIVAVVDAYDAMMTDRIYRKAPGSAYAVNELRQFSGTQFDPEVIHAFFRGLERR
jgi:putative nucleotidyltransferase with HDIG domain